MTQGGVGWADACKRMGRASWGGATSVDGVSAGTERGKAPGPGAVVRQAELRKVEPRRSGPVQSADQVARAIVRCARHPRPEVYPYRPARLLAVLSALAPGPVDWMVTRLIRR